MYPAAQENVTRYYVLFVRVAIKQRAAQLRVFHHNFDTRPAVLLLSTKTYWGRNWPIHVSTMYTNLVKFAVSLLLGIVLALILVVMICLESCC